jgi:hypothetical protein
MNASFAMAQEKCKKAVAVAPLMIWVYVRIAGNIALHLEITAKNVTEQENLNNLTYYL